MKLLILAALLVQAARQETGTVTGMVRGANGAPASGVRVYSVVARDTAEVAPGPVAFENLTETDASGRYRLSVPSGRYYIASGSVSAPTFYPGTSDISAARVVTVIPGGTIDNVDFSSFIPATRFPSFGTFSMPAGSTGVLSGIVTLADGTPASGLAVAAVSSGWVSNGGNVPGAVFTTSRQPGSNAVFTITLRNAGGWLSQRRTDANGQYRIDGVPPDTYYIVAGFAEAPTFYPGVADAAAASTVVTTPTTQLTRLNFVVPVPQRGVTVRGRATASNGGLAAGANVRLQPQGAKPLTSSFGLPAMTAIVQATTRSDGAFEFEGIRPGRYTVEVIYSGVGSIARELVVTDQPITDIEITVPVAVLSGQILFEDGSIPSEPEVFEEAIVTAVSNPNRIVSTILPISRDGKFNRIMEPDTYRFYLRTLPEDYVVTSVTAGIVDLLKGPLTLTGTDAVNVEVRVAKRTAQRTPPGVSVSGTVRDSVTGMPAPASRLTLCCLDGAVTERLSTPMRPDGSFEFSGVPPGLYLLGLQPINGNGNLYPVNSSISVGVRPVSGLAVASTPQFGWLNATVVLADGRALPENVRAAVVFTGTGGRTRVVADRGQNGARTAALPIGDKYTVSVEDLPEGYRVKSIIGSTEVVPQNFPQTGAPTLPTPIVITVDRISPTIR